jgi:hypothetical protein
MEVKKSPQLSFWPRFLLDILGAVAVTSGILIAMWIYFGFNANTPSADGRYWGKYSWEKFEDWLGWLFVFGVLFLMVWQRYKRSRVL